MTIEFAHFVIKNKQTPDKGCFSLILHKNINRSAKSSKHNIFSSFIVNSSYRGHEDSCVVLSISVPCEAEATITLYI